MDDAVYVQKISITKERDADDESDSLSNESGAIESSNSDQIEQPKLHTEKKRPGFYPAERINEEDPGQQNGQLNSNLGRRDNKNPTQDTAQNTTKLLNKDDFYNSITTFKQDVLLDSNINDEDQPGFIPTQVLYKEALYTAYHYLGKPTERYAATKQELLNYIHIAFPAPLEEQKATFLEVTKEPFPITIINATVRGADGLDTEDGSADGTYCLISIDTEDSGLLFQLMEGKQWARVSFSASSPSSVTANKMKKKKDKKKKPEKRDGQAYYKVPNSIKSTIKYHTTHPTWNQRFQCVELHAEETACKDVFALEVWEHDDEVLYGMEHKEVVSTSPKIYDDGIKEIEYAFHLGKRDIFLGKCSVKVRDIPCDGEEVWFRLTGTTHRNTPATGKVLMDIWMAHVYRHGTHYVEYAEPKITLLKLWEYLLHYESKHFVGEAHWNGQVSPTATCLLFQYAIQNGISVAFQGYTKWKAYSKYDLEPSGVNSMLSELHHTLCKNNDHLEDWRSEIESILFQLLYDKILPILRNHLLGEPEEKVRQALKAIQKIIAILTLFNFYESIHRINVFLKDYIKLCVLDWYEVRFYENVTSKYKKGITDYELIDLYKEMMVQVNQVLIEGINIWSILFWTESSIDYMPIMYNELQKMMEFDVEEISWRFTYIPYSNNDKMRRILLRLNDADVGLCKNLYELYHQAQLFVEKPKEIITNTNENQIHPLLNFYEWFRPALMLWLGFAFIRSCILIEKSIRVDNAVGESDFVNTSSSSVHTIVVLNQLSTFWTELNWPVFLENYIIAHFLIEVIAYDGVLYAIIKCRKIEDEEYFFEENTERFEISEKLCIALNNIELVKSATLDSFMKFDTPKLIAQLEKEIGVASAKKERIQLEKIMSGSIKSINEKVGLILVGIKSRVKPEIRPDIDDCLVKQIKNPDGLEKLLLYMEDNIILLKKRLIPSIFNIVLQVFWKAFCEELKGAVLHFRLKNPSEKKKFFSHAKEIVQEVINYFKGNGSGLSDDEINCAEYKDVEKLISM